MTTSTDQTHTKRRMTIMLICVLVLFGGIFLYKAFLGWMIKKYMSSQSQVITVSATTLKYELWQPKLKASGSLRAVRGVNVTTELAAKVNTIYFTPGSVVTEGALLTQLNAASDIAQLRSLEANVELAKITYQRDKSQFTIQAVSKAILDADFANLKSLEAQVAQQAAIVAKKTIRAPFSGRLGVSMINPGQYINAGDPIVTLQQLDPIYVDFYLPQQELHQLKVGQLINLTVDTFPKKSFSGKITTINPIVDTQTRNVKVEATITNPSLELLPGMFASVEIYTGTPLNFLTLPQTAISFNPYGDIVFLINKEKSKTKKNQTILKVTQHFVTLGETRGDQVKILQGLKAGDQVVTSGQLKLKNGSEVVINNSIAPANNPMPVTIDE
jgi:membrane fusion protein (multidrug efflux system)